MTKDHSHHLITGNTLAMPGSVSLSIEVVDGHSAALKEPPKNPTLWQFSSVSYQEDFLKVFAQVTFAFKVEVLA